MVSEKRNPRPSDQRAITQFEVDTDACVLLARNPQYLTPVQMDALTRSIAREGFLVPIVVRKIAGKRYEVVSGNHRLLAAKKLGYKKIPAVLADLDAKTAKRVALNLNTVHVDPRTELMVPFLSDLEDDVLAEVYLPEVLAADIGRFDATLQAALDRLAVPHAIDADSSTTEIQTCVCPTCGRKHFRGALAH